MRALARLDAVRAQSSLVDVVLGLGFWRYIDPAPLTTIELEPKSEQAAACSTKLILWPLLERRLLRGFLDQLRNGLYSDDARYAAMDGLWLRLRASNDIRDLGPYVLCVLVWLEAMVLLKRDPVFGVIADDLYAYTAYHFGRVRLDPQSADVFEQALETLRRMFIEPTSVPNMPIAFVGSQDLHQIDLVGPPQPGRRHRLFE